ncbi:MAG: ribosome biogenesis GTPase Der [Candidatus Omnitrophica bacterium]|nr:ribosome biogenesis GTPase Der [Candidatus Omnitrophota bacterium]
MKKINEIALVGRPNVGKSSIFNCIVRARRAIVHQERGTTRDRITETVTFKDKRFILTDTGGYISGDKTRILKMVKGQIEKAIDDSDILLFICDAKAGPLPEDFELAAILRKSNKKIFLAVNKVDNENMRDGVVDFYQLGLDKPYPVSAAHDIGIDELLEDVTAGFSLAGPAADTALQLKVAIVGRPNAGKSSFVNYLLKEERVIVDETPGTTRDAIDTLLKEDGTEYILIDTAGLRHKRKLKEAADIYGMMRAKEAIKRSQVVLVLIDACAGLLADDLGILDMVIDEGKDCIVCVNKWDLVKGLAQDDYKENLYDRAKFLTKYPVIFTSTKTGYNVYNSLKLIREVTAASSQKVSTHRLNKLLDSLKRGGPFRPGKNKLKVNFMTQIKTNPPTFLMFIDGRRFVTEDHMNFIENALRRNFGFFGAPVKFEFRESKSKIGG